MLKLPYKNLHRIHFVTVFIFIFSFAVMTRNIAASFNYDSDFGRDINGIFDITRGNITLLGPKSSFGGIYTGPLYFYLFAPVLKLSGYNLFSLLYFNAALFSVAMSYFYYFVHNKFGSIKAVISSISLLLLPVVLYSSRNPGNAYTYIPLLIIFITAVLLNKPVSRITLFFLGIAGGIVITTHYSNAVVVSLLSLYLLFTVTGNKKVILYYIAGTALPFIPLFIFEIRHNFIMIRNTFITNSMSTFTGNGLPEKQGGTSPVFMKNVMFINNEMKFLLRLPAAAYLAAAASITWQMKNKKTSILFFSSLLIFLIFSLIFTQLQYTQFYLFSAALFIYLCTVFLLLRSRFWLLLIPLVLYQFFTFPSHLYAPSHRKPGTFERAVQYVIDKKLIQKQDSFNVIQIRPDTDIAPYGFEYRYFFKKYGYEPAPIDAYAGSGTLLIFSEIKNLDLKKLSGWEVDQFGPENFASAQKYTLPDITVYKVRKQ